MACTASEGERRTWRANRLLSEGQGEPSTSIEVKTPTAEDRTSTSCWSNAEAFEADAALIVCRLYRRWRSWRELGFLSTEFGFEFGFAKPYKPRQTYGQRGRPERLAIVGRQLRAVTTTTNVRMCELAEKRTCAIQNSECV